MLGTEPRALHILGKYSALSRSTAPLIIFCLGSSAYCLILVKCHPSRPQTAILPFSLAFPLLLCSWVHTYDFFFVSCLHSNPGSPLICWHCSFEDDICLLVTSPSPCLLMPLLLFSTQDRYLSGLVTFSSWYPTGHLAIFEILDFLCPWRSSTTPRHWVFLYSSLSVLFSFSFSSRLIYIQFRLFLGTEACLCRCHPLGYSNILLPSPKVNPSFCL